MLKGIPTIISPELLKILMEMGHGDTIVIADGNFPASNYAKRLVRADGHNIPDVLKAILKLFPIDTYSKNPLSLMSIVQGDTVVPTIWKDYENIIKKDFSNFSHFNFLERFDFYEKSKEAYAIISTSEEALYANIILTKGVL
ncbi:RbsD/FucU family protein [Clostridium chauvoei]|uniref:Fucose isomerase n=2 Tax=Clostridium chauvoei TaxID=46867 RepID=A0ABD4REK7_9CLOT|nr:RbsD/FucU domain-containing protein [Clostridium chauvoei]ATD55040.1 fucose isomerase [Clostridium chauvoei]MBX7279381.1 fucose isomerase [Clostridium chauvoei]MBX7282533.1 fucose isomerase [Clostridium chauvoei]MBX7285579.1 fucose isomerase [Clostridium chauvoei]MBX7287335.1 fucose isomerase [Clostridium chauvoei]